MVSPFLVWVWVASADATLARRRDRGSKRKGTSRETDKSNAVSSRPSRETASVFFRRKSLAAREGGALSHSPAAAGRKAHRRQAGIGASRIVAEWPGPVARRPDTNFPELRQKGRVTGPGAPPFGCKYRRRRIEPGSRSKRGDAQNNWPHKARIRPFRRMPPSCLMIRDGENNARGSGDRAPRSGVRATVISRSPAGLAGVVRLPLGQAA